MFAPLGNIGWSVALRVGSTSSGGAQRVLDLQGASLYVQNGSFFFVVAERDSSDVMK
jgi:hypothetical protein